MATATPTLLTAEALSALDPEVHAEIVGGELVVEAMTRFEHGDAQSSIAVEIKSRFGGSGSGRSGWWLGVETTVEYTSHEVYRHDLAGWRKARVPQRPVGFPILTRPDWVCEVLSTNRRKDLVEKREVLHAAVVGHYWLVDLDSMLLTVLRHHPDGYLVVKTVSPGDVARLEPFDAVELEVERLFGDLSQAPPPG